MYRSGIKAALNTVNIAEVVRLSGVELKRNKACCPFHQEETPSFSVHPQKNIWRCFGCGAGGDAVEYVKMFYGLDFMRAVSWLNDSFNLGLKLKGQRHESRESKEKRIDQSISSTLNKLYARQFKRAEMALIAHFRKLHQTIVSFVPPRGADIADFPESYIAALNAVDRIGSYCDIMMSGSFSDKKELIEAEEVKQIEREFYR